MSTVAAQQVLIGRLKKHAVLLRAARKGQENHMRDSGSPQKKASMVLAILDTKTNE